jgi:uncharacterized membrane protein YeaQ/YmgE (transglycosylase-associated protein family)
MTPGSNEPQGFILSTILGIVGAFVATYLGQALGWYRADEGAGLIGAMVGMSALGQLHKPQKQAVAIALSKAGPVWTPLNPADKSAHRIAKFGSDTLMKRRARPEEIACRSQVE